MEFSIDQLVSSLPFDIQVYKINRDIDHVKLIFHNRDKKSDHVQTNTISVSIKDYIKGFDVVCKSIKLAKCKQFFDPAHTIDKIELETSTDHVILEYLSQDIFYQITCVKIESEFILSSASSKIRNPLTNIVGLVPIIQSYKKDDKKFQNYVELIKQSSGDIVSVANDLVDILNYKKNKIIIKKEEVNLSEMVSECIKIMLNKSRGKKITLSYDISPTLPKIIYTDKDKLKQVLINLLSNSIKFTNIGSVVVVVEEEDREKGPAQSTWLGPNILFKVKDTGIGISDDKKEFINAILCGKKMITSYKFSGFGLYISKFICELLGGDLWYRSDVDIGTIFCFNITCDVLT